MILRRLRNLWRLSAYVPDDRAGDVVHVGADYGYRTFRKDFPTIKHKLATIVGVEKPDLFADEGEDSK